MPLTEPAITEATTITAPARIIGEWLAMWFDGASHDVGAHTGLAFPQCKVEWGLSTPGEVGGKVKEIRFVYGSTSENVCPEPGVPHVSEAKTVIDFYVRLDAVGDDARPDALAVANLLKLIIDQPEGRAGLAERGIENLRAQRPVLMPGGRFEVVLVKATCRMTHALTGRL